MTDRKEIETLRTKAELMGGMVKVTTDAEGRIETLQVTGINGVGPFPMSPIAFAERMRDIFSKEDRIDATIAQLAGVFAGVEKIDPTSPTVLKMRATLAKLEPYFLRKIIRQNVKFLRVMAATELRRRGLSDDGDAPALAIRRATDTEIVMDTFRDDEINAPRVGQVSGCKFMNELAKKLKVDFIKIEGGWLVKA